MDPPTNPSKRTRFDTTAQVPATSETANAPKYPLALANLQICRHVELLLPKIATIIKMLALSHICLVAKAYNKRTQILKMETNDEFFPCSACLKFELLVLKEAKESPEYLALKEKNEARLIKYKHGLKKTSSLQSKLKSRLPKQISRKIYQNPSILSLAPSSLPTITNNRPPSTCQHHTGQKP
jgi:hypothetical protein